MKRNQATKKWRAMRIADQCGEQHAKITFSIPKTKTHKHELIEEQQSKFPKRVGKKNEKIVMKASGTNTDKQRAHKAMN